MEERYFLVNRNDPILHREISYDDYEYIKWVQEREEENRQRGQLRKRTWKERLASIIFLLGIVFISIAQPVFNIGVDKDHVTNSTWVADMTELTELVEAEYVFIKGEQVHGVYFGGEDLIIVERRADDTTYIHELAHASDKHNYFPWEQELKNVLMETYRSNNMDAPIFDGYSLPAIRTELYADAILYMETGQSGTYFNSADTFILTNTVKNFMKINNISFETLDNEVDYLTPDRVIEGSITKSEDIDHLH